MNFEFGLERYSTTASIVSSHRANHDINLVAGQTIKVDEINRVNKFLTRYINDHWEILDLIKYINILWYIAQTTNTNLHFINYSQCWDTNYFQPVDFAVPTGRFRGTGITQVTKNILQSEFRDDQEVSELYSLIHNQYKSAGGIKEDLWLNLYSPLKKLQVDTGNDGNHPGLKSQALFFEYFEKILKHK
jgi:hypothetical protein